MSTNVANMPDPNRERAVAGARWFWWIAGLSLINSIIVATGSTWNFMAGLGITQMIDQVVKEMDPATKMIGLGVDVLVAGVFVAIGAGAMRNTKAYVAGMALYALDSLLFVLAQDWFGLAFHGLVLWFLWQGLNARRAMAQPTPATTPSNTMDRAA